MYWLALIGVGALALALGVAAFVRRSRFLAQFDLEARASIGQIRYRYRYQEVDEDLRARTEARRAAAEKTRRRANQIATGAGARPKPRASVVALNTRKQA
jgi:hypothetical protein